MCLYLFLVINFRLSPILISTSTLRSFTFSFTPSLPTDGKFLPPRHRLGVSRVLDQDFASVPLLIYLHSKFLRRLIMIMILPMTPDLEPSPAGYVAIFQLLVVLTGPDFTFIPAAPSPVSSTWFDRVYCLMCSLLDSLVTCC
jgi:hypothetical protein